MNTKKIGFLETRYSFYDNDSHTINAFVRNQCEKEILAIAQEVFKVMGLDKKLTIEITPSRKGSYVDFFIFLVNHTKFPEILLAGLAVIAGLMSISRETKLDTELKNKQIESINLDIIKKTLEIQEMTAKSKKEEDLISKIEELVRLNYDNLAYNPIISRHISNFYKHVLDYEKIEHMEYTPYDQHQQPITKTRVVYREQFESFIITTSEDEQIDTDAKIYIHSPVLVKGKRHWSGFYTLEEKAINFSMLDKEFKEDVTNGTINFSNGSFIYAVLRKTIKYDELGNVKSQNYAVEEVKQISNDNNYHYNKKRSKDHQSLKEKTKKQFSLDFET
ncbi:MAG: hypothetical protein Q3971_07265 [Moraxella sp.]|nr:hypothetical protein [Moraxella sp.]